MVFHCIFLGKRGSLLHPNTAQGSFFPLQSYCKKALRKNVQKSALKYKRNVLMPPGHPIILLKSNWFNMAAVSVKRSIRLENFVTVMINGTTVVIKFYRDGSRGLRKPVRRTDLESGSSNIGYVSEQFFVCSVAIQTVAWVKVKT